MACYMTDAEYRDTQRVLIEIWIRVQGLDLDGFIDRIDECEGVAPLLDPMLYRRGRVVLNRIKAWAEAARALQKIS